MIGTAQIRRKMIDAVLAGQQLESWSPLPTSQYGLTKYVFVHIRVHVRVAVTDSLPFEPLLLPVTKHFIYVRHRRIRTGYSGILLRCD